MSLVEILSIISCLTSTITMIVVMVAVLPHIKQGMAIVRDAVLWIVLVLFIAMLIWAGLTRLPDAGFTEPSMPPALLSSDEAGVTRSTSRYDWGP